MLFISLFLGILLGIIATIFYKSKSSTQASHLLKQQLTTLNLEHTNTQTNLTKSNTLLQHVQSENKKLNHIIQEIRTQYLQSEKSLSELTSEQKNAQTLQNQVSVFFKDLTQNIIEDKKKLHTQFTDHFTNISQNILENKSKQFQINSEKHLSILLNPLKDTIGNFQTKIEETYKNESRERFSLKDKIKELCDVHDNLKHETKQLSKALKGDVKAQGQWGEMVLNHILETSGLKEGEHYITQGSGLNLKNDDGKIQKPDVIIKLPDNKQIIIDAKVSLTHYERFITSESESLKNNFLTQFTQSLRSHITVLSKKKYHLENSLNTPEFVLMFFPIEGAFSLALQTDTKLFNFSWDHSIVIVSPTTLLATLRTIDSLWKKEKQTRNAIEIAQTSGRLYDKFVLFTKDLLQVGDSLKKAEQNYNQAFQKLNTGNGNIMSKLEKIKQLGAKASKNMPNNVISSPKIPND